MTPGTTISHYRIVSQLGRGGMGIVYKAEDTKLDRTVALKLLPPHALISEDDRARFYREARAAAALNHPNIAHVYEIDEASRPRGAPPVHRDGVHRRRVAGRPNREGTSYHLLMSYHDRLGPGRRPEGRARQGDRAPGYEGRKCNADVSRRPKDSGLRARQRRPLRRSSTQMGSTLGTVAYMSPEQAKGEEVDPPKRHLVARSHHL